MSTIGAPERTNNSVSTACTVMLAITLGVITAYIFFPGLMSFDSILQYRQVIDDMPVSNYHPPIMVYLWKLGNSIFGPGGLLVFHQLMYWGAICVIAICIHNKALVRLIIVLTLGLLPPLWIHSATIWNDVGVMSSFLAAVACGMLISRTGSKWLLFFAFCFLLYGLSAKRTALLAVIPLVVLICDAYFSVSSPNQAPRYGTWKQTLTLSLAFTTCVLAISILVNSIGVEKTTKWPTVAIWDISAVSIAENTFLIPDSVPHHKGETATETLKMFEEAFKPEVNAPLMAVVELLPGPESHRQLFGLWVSLPWRYPESYFTHRGRVFSRLLGLGTDDVYFAFEHRILSNDFGLRLLNEDSNIYKRSIQWVTKSAGTLVYKSWFYLLLILTITTVTVFRLSRHNRFEERLVMWVGLSRLLYVLPLFFIAPAADFRYNLWMIACSAVMVCITFGRRLA